MPITVTCGCKKKFTVKDSFAGKRIKCPACARSIVVPAPVTDMDEDEANTLIYGQDGREEIAEPPRLIRGGDRKKSKKSAKKSPTKTNAFHFWMIGTGASGGLLLIALLWWPFWPSRWAADFAANAKDTGETVLEYIDPPPPGVVRLPRALSQPPDWLVEEAPFDVRKFWVTVPDDENAAPLYLDALYEFSPIMEVCFPLEDRKQRTPAIKARVQRVANVERDWINAKYRNDLPRRVSLQERDAILDEYAAGFDKLFRAQDRPSCVFEIGWDNAAQIPLIQGARSCARVIQHQFGREIERANFDAAIRLTATILRLSRDLRYRPGSLSTVVAISIDNLAMFDMIIPLLKLPGLKVVHCDELMRILVQHETSLREIDPFLRSIQGDYLSKRMLLYDLEHRSGEFADSKYHHAFGTNNASRGSALISALNGDPRDVGTDPVHRSFATFINVLLSHMKHSDYRECADLLKEKVEFFATKRNEPFKVRMAAYQEFVTNKSSHWMSDIRVSTSSVPSKKDHVAVSDALDRQLYWGAKPAPKLAYYFSVVLLEQNLNGGVGNYSIPTDINHQTRLQAAKALVALRRWYGTHATPPIDFAVMCREAGIEEIPRDFYGTGSLRMATFAAETQLKNFGIGPPTKLIGGETVIYSVGTDGIDDMALKGGTTYSFDEPGDWLFRLEIPQSAITPE